jgi:hypothetical protein
LAGLQTARLPSYLLHADISAVKRKEELMNVVKHAGVLALAVFCTGLALVPVANAAAADAGVCIQMSKQVTQALDAAQAGQATQDAKQELFVGRQFCSNGMYAQGVFHFEKALKLLGKP